LKLTRWQWFCAAAVGVRRAPTCPDTLPGESFGKVSDSQINECSGLAASRKEADLYWINNDSGDGPVLYGIRKNGKHVARLRVENAGSNDWEDIAIGPGPDGSKSYIYIADVGDNFRRRGTVQIYRLEEPEVPEDSNPYEEIKVQAERFDVTYPHGKKYDCEAVFIDQGDAAKAQNTSGRVYFITKGDNQNMNPEWRGGDLFYVDLPQKSSSVDIQETHIRLDIVLATGADMTPSGSLIAVRTYGEIRIYPRAHSVERSLAKQPCGVASENERQGEAVAFGKDGESYITVSEGRFAKVWSFHLSQKFQKSMQDIAIKEAPKLEGPAAIALKPAAACWEIANAMGRGINIGKTYETGNRRSFQVVKEQVKWIKDQNFSHVRLPVEWGEHFNASSELTREITEVVDFAISLGLYVVINAHHQSWLKDHYDGSQHFNQLFWSLWHDIALHFQSRDGHLIFEILNKPAQAFGSWDSGSQPRNPHPFDPVAIDRTREINGVGYDAVRRISPGRMVFLSPNAMASIATASYVYPDSGSLPGGGQDECVGVEVHTFDPWDFAGDTGKNAYYTSIDDMKKNLLYDVWEKLRIWQFTSGITLYVGEFGVGRRDQSDRNTELVHEYYKFAMNHFRMNGWAAAAWDAPGSYQIFDQTNGISHQLAKYY